MLLNGFYSILGFFSVLSMESSFIQPGLTIFRNLINDIVDRNYSISESCMIQLKELKNINSEYFKNFISYSGKFYNDFGQYDICKSLNNTNYLEFHVTLPNTVCLKIGLCLPNKCRAEDFRIYAPKIAELATKAYNETIDPSAVEFTDVVQTREKLSQKGVGFYLFWIIFFSIIIFLIVATIIDSQQGQNNNKLLIINEKSMIRDEDKEKITEVSWLSCFNILKNYRSFVEIPASIFPELSNTNGFRSICIIYFLFGQGFLQILLIPVFNIQTVSDFLLTTYQATIPLTFSYSTDAFYFLSGFLSICGLVRFFEVEKNRTCIRVLQIYLIRYLILIPFIALILGFKFYLITFIADTPMISYFDDQLKYCREQWWSQLIFMGNFFAEYFTFCNQNTWYNLDRKSVV